MDHMPHSQPHIWHWAIGCGLAEFFGIALAALWWVAIDRIEPAPETTIAVAVSLVAKVGSGLIEGLILGYAQATILLRTYHALSRNSWIVATTALAVLGWLVGSAPAILMGAGGGGQTAAFDPSIGATAVYAAIFGLAVGALFGGAQWVVFRKAAAGALWWIPANMAGWAVALPVIYLAASVGEGSMTFAQIAVRGIIGGLIAGLLLGFVTGLFFGKISPKAHSEWERKP